MIYIQYAHMSTATLKSGKKAVYFKNIYSGDFGTKMCGDDKIYKLTFVPHINQERDKEEVEYWGWLNNEGELSMVYANYFLFDMCFPNGAEATEAFGRGKRIKLELINFVDEY
jgi:hypothetical protein